MGISNTASLQTNFNVDPYYDDYDEDKNYHRILYRPGLAVQARELTQQQTILQNQIDRFAEHIFKEGSVVRGGEMSYDSTASFVKIRDNDQSGASVNVASFENTKVTGSSSGVIAEVVDSLTGSESATPNTKTLYIKYLSSGTDKVTKTFQSGEVLTSNTGLSANVITGTQSVVANTGSRVTFGAGVMYAKDHFVRFDKQSIVIGRYSANTSIKVGYDISETVVSSTSDLSLLDPARGSFNFAAPGADRLKLTATLTTKAVDDTNTDNFVERLRVKNGRPEFLADKPVYSQINDYLAKRTFQESGNYIVDGMSVRIRENLNSANNQGVFTAAEGGNSTKLSVDVAPGKAVVQGYDIENIITNHVAVDKGNDFESIEDASIPANYGNYAVVDEVVGTWDTNGHDRVFIYDAAQNAISNNSFSATTPVGSKIGEARVRAVQYNSGSKGTPSGQYRFHLYDIVMTANSFANARSIYHDNSTFDGFADFVLTANAATISEPSFNKAVFNVPAENIRRLRDSDGNVDNTFKFLKEFDVTIAADGTVTLTTGSSDEQFPFSTGALNDTQERENFHLVLKGTANSASAVDTTASRAAGANTITGLTSVSSKYNVGDILQLQSEANTFVVTSIVNSTAVGISGPGANTGPALSSVTAFKGFVSGQTISLNGVGGDASARTITINSATSATFDIQETLNGTVAASITTELNKVDGQEIAKNLQSDTYVQLRISDNPAGTAGPWNLGHSDSLALKEVRYKTGNAVFSTTSEGTDVTNQFTLDSGMRDNFYDHAKLKLKSGSSHTVANGNVYLVKMDYFTHDTSQGIGYFSIDSYPIDDANTANSTAISTGEIPIFTSPVTGDRIDLRNAIDIRPRIADTANNVTTLTNISTNPATSNTITEPTGGLRFMAPNESLVTDLDYYLPRKDRVAVNALGEFKTIRGVPSLNPQTPPAPSDSMTLAVADITPFPSLPYENAKRINRTDLAVSIEPVRNERFTMRDIGVIKERVDRLEYYTSLSLLENDTKNLVISDEAGNDRFKNGFLVDQFTGHSVGNVFDEDYKIAVDPQKNELRPSFKLDDVQMNFQQANSVNVVASANDATLSIASSAALYSNGETVSSGSASGVLTYQVDQKLYLEQVAGTFTANTANAIGSTSGATSVISSVSTPTDGKLITLPYTHDVLIDQDAASDTRNLAGLFWNFAGEVTLDPANDYWVDTVVAPEVQVDFDQNNGSWRVLSNPWGSQWNNWTDVWTGRQDPTAQVITRSSSDGLTVVGQNRTGIQAQVRTPNQRTVSLGETIRDVNIIPFMRSQTIDVSAVGMKPDTRLYAFFDGENVSSFVTPTDSSFANTASEGSNLVSDSNGNVYATFRLPNEDSVRFRTGTLNFKLTDSPTNSETALTTGVTSFTASGLTQVAQDTVISSRPPPPPPPPPRPTVTAVAPQRNIIPRSGPDGPDGGGDPLAQTFKVSLRSDEVNTTTSSGAFLTKIDLFFSSKDENQPVSIEIREVDPTSLQITQKLIPLSRVTVSASEVNTSTDGSKPTPFTFNTPIYLLNNTEYAMIVKPGGNNPNYNAFVSRLGENDLLTGNRIVKQPFSGILFASANDRQYTAIQEEDLKFRAYFANFGQSQTGTAVLKNVDKEYLTLNAVSASFSTVGESVHGETTLTMTAPLTVNVGDTVVGNTSSANGTVTNVSGSDVRVKSVTLANKFANNEIIDVYASGVQTSTLGTISTTSTPTGKIHLYDASTQANTTLHLSSPSGIFVANTEIRGQTGGQTATIQTIDNLPVDNFHTHLTKLDLQGTTTAVTGKLATSPTQKDTVFRNINDNGDTAYSARRYTLSKSNETSNLSGQKSNELSIEMTNSLNRRHSPAIDNDLNSLFVAENIINNDSAGEDGTAGGNALARYITRTVTLADGQDAEDLKVFLTAYKPSSADIKVYAKILHREDGDTLEDRSWIELSQNTLATVVSDGENTEDFKEFEYTMPTSSLTGPNSEVQYTNSGSVTYTGFKYFSIKIVLLSTSPSRVPRLRDFRSVALQK